MHANAPSRSIWMLILGLVIFGVLAWLLNSFPPDSSGLIGAFFLLAGLGASLLLSFLFNNMRRGVLLGVGVVLFLLLRLLGLHNILYVLLLTIVLVSLELTWKKR